MKALTFFSNFKNKAGNDTEPAVDIEALQNSVLTKRNAKKLEPKRSESKKSEPKKTETKASEPKTTESYKAESKTVETKKIEKPNKS